MAVVNYVCPRCNGKKKIGFFKRKICDWCNGTGELVIEFKDPLKHEKIKRDRAGPTDEEEIWK